MRQRVTYRVSVPKLLERIIEKGMTQLMHWNLCKQYELNRCRKWYDHKTETVIENENVKILWDMSIQTDHVIIARRPDIVVREKVIKHSWLIDVAVPGDERVKET